MSTALLLLTAASPAPTTLGNPGDNPNHVGPGAVAFWIVIALGVGLFLLVKSMGRQMKRIDFDDGSGTLDSGAGSQDAQPGASDRRRSGSPATRAGADQPVGGAPDRSGRRRRP